MQLPVGRRPFLIPTYLQSYLGLTICNPSFNLQSYLQLTYPCRITNLLTVSLLTTSCRERIEMFLLVVKETQASDQPFKPFQLRRIRRWCCCTTDYRYKTKPIKTVFWVMMGMNEFFWGEMLWEEAWLLIAMCHHPSMRPKRTFSSFSEDFSFCHCGVWECAEKNH